MKFIVNSKYFRINIEKAIELKARFLETNNDEIYFLTRSDSVMVQTHVLETSDERQPFEVDKWEKIVAELNKLPEQPITVELRYNKVEIYCVMVLPITDQL